MHVIVGIFPQLIEVGRHRVVDFRLYRTFSVGLPRPRGIENYDREFILAGQPPADALAGSERHGDLRSSWIGLARSGIEHPLQQRQSFIAGSDPSQIPRDGMAAGAATGFVEIAPA